MLFLTVFAVLLTTGYAAFLPAVPHFSVVDHGKRSAEDQSGIASSKSVVDSAGLQVPRYPPGYPARPYSYRVRNSDIILHCWKFDAQPHQNPTAIDLIFSRIAHQYGDAPHRNDEVFPTTQHGGRSWFEEQPDESDMGLILSLSNVGRVPETKMTYGDFLDAIHGLNYIRLTYPELDIRTVIYKKIGEQRVQLGLLWLEWIGPDVAALVSSS
ncbi:MAG: hypothetical protein L6R39_003218 [Caloplaca ligustica]|nr:MAG: hypothetical protein L6R39_003218 [Caloplaca ligustica]